MKQKHKNYLLSGISCLIAFIAFLSLTFTAFKIINPYITYTFNGFQFLTIEKQIFELASELNSDFFDKSIFYEGFADTLRITDSSCKATFVISKILIVLTIVSAVISLFLAILSFFFKFQFKFKRFLKTSVIISTCSTLSYLLAGIIPTIGFNHNLANLTPAKEFKFGTVSFAPLIIITILVAVLIVIAKTVKIKNDTQKKNVLDLDTQNEVITSLLSLIKIKDLHIDGALSYEEYMTEKKSLLNGLDYTKTDKYQAIKTLNLLKEKGILTPWEFNQEKIKILGYEI